MFSTGQSTCPVKYLKKLIQVLNPGEEVLFQRPKRKFCAADEIWFDRAPLGVNTLGNMMKEISIAAKVPNLYKPLYKGYFKPRLHCKTWARHG